MADDSTGTNDMGCDLQVDLGWLHYLRDKPLIEWQVGSDKH